MDSAGLLSPLPERSHLRPKSKASPLRVAVVGASPDGFGARAHLPGIHAADGVELAAICTAHDETAKSAADLWNAPRWYGDLDALLEDEEVDLVTVAVKPRAHHPIAKAVLEAGKMVYCEWPLALNTSEAGDLAALAADRSIATGVGLQGRWVPALRHLRDLVSSGSIGRPISFYASQELPTFDIAADRAWLARESEASGALFVASAHVTDAVRFVLSEPEAIVGIRTTLRPDDTFTDTGEPFRWEASDTVSYLARLAGGVIGTVNVSNITDPPRGFTLRILGDEGQLVATAPGYYQFTPVTLQAGKPGGQLETVDIPAHLWGGTDLDEGHAGANVGRSLAAFASALHGGTKFEPDFAQGLELHRIIDALIESSDSQAWVDV